MSFFNIIFFKYFFDSLFRFYQTLSRKQLFPTKFILFNTQESFSCLKLSSIKNPILFIANPNYKIFVGDKENTYETYSAGRFIYTEKNNKLILNLNNSYNPSFAFSPFAARHLPLQKKQIKIFIEAEEKKFLWIKIFFFNNLAVN